MMDKKQLPRESYTVGWLCALSESELVAAMDMLDEEHSPCDGMPSDDENTYWCGSISGHNVVIACMPPGLPGKVSALKLTQPLSRSFPNMKIHLFVGIGGGIPINPPPLNSREDIHLGDVVVGWSGSTGKPGVVSYDHRRAQDNYIGGELLTNLGKPDRRLLNALGLLLANYKRRKINFAEHLKRSHFSHPGLENDRLYEPTYRHQSDGSCTYCNPERLAKRPARETTELTFHRGTILSGDLVMQDAQMRDDLSKRHFNAICFETEAAGVMDEKHCLVIRGISDYSDSHKNYMWHEYAAATAAAFARQFLYILPPIIIPVEKPEKPIQSKEMGNIPQKTLFKVPHIDKQFTGRENILSEIEAQFNSEPCVALIGVGGVGKSDIALEYCHRFHKAHPSDWVLWINYSSKERLQTDYEEVAFMLELPERNGISFIETFRLVWKQLSAKNNNTGRNWLMVIDSLDLKDDLLQEYIPQAHNGRILITTRSKEVATLMKAPKIDIMPMGHDDAVNLLKKKLPINSNSDHISQLAKSLGGVPVAITQAAAYISNNEIVSIPQYISWVNKISSGQTLSEDGRQIWEYDNTISTILRTWEISFKQIITKPKAGDLLSLMCFLDPAKIPQSLISRNFTDFDFANAIGTLLDFSFVSVVKESGEQERSFQMIEITQVAMRNWLQSNNKMGKELGKVLELLDQNFPNSEYESKESWQECRMLAPHVAKALQYDKNVSQNKKYEGVIHWRASLLHNLTTYSWRQGEYSRSLELCEELLDFRSNDRTSVLKTKALKGRVFNSMGKFGEAVKLHKEVLVERKKVLGKQNRDTLKSMNDLGQALRNEGKYKDAEKIYRQALEGTEKVLGYKHPDMLSIMSDLAGVLADQEEYATAEQIFRDTLEKKVAELGEEHPSTLVTMEHLAEVLAVQEKYPEAEERHRQVFHLYESVLGEKHPDTLCSLSGLSAVLLEQGKLEEAKRQFQKALHLFEQVLGADHSYTLAVMMNLGFTVRELGDCDEAIRLYKTALEKMTISLGESHPNTIDCLEALESTLRDHGDVAEADKLHFQRETILNRENTSQHLLQGSIMGRIFESLMSPFRIMLRSQKD